MGSGVTNECWKSRGKLPIRTAYPSSPIRSATLGQLKVHNSQKIFISSPIPNLSTPWISHIIYFTHILILTSASIKRPSSNHTSSKYDSLIWCNWLLCIFLRSDNNRPTCSSTNKRNYNTHVHLIVVLSLSNIMKIFVYTDIIHHTGQCRERHWVDALKGQLGTI